MSKEDGVDDEFIFDVIKLVVGTLIFVIISLLMQSWELQREEILGSSPTPAVGVYILIPIIVGILTFGATVFIQGLFSVGGVLLTRAQQSQGN